MSFLILLISFLFAPELVSAQDLAGAAGCDGPTCTACNVVSLANAVINWLIAFLTLVFAVIAVIAGFGLVTSGGNQSALDDAKSKFTNAIIGFLIILSAWLVVDTIFRGIVSQDGIVPNAERSGGLFWGEIQCQTVRTPQAATTEFITLEGTGDSFEAIEAAGVDSAAWGDTIGAIGQGNTAIVAFAQAMQARQCIYSQPRRNGCSTNPGYTDCSDLVNVAYRAAGCRSPGATTASQYPNASSIGSPSTLRPGDSIVYRRSNNTGHIVICMNSGCSQVIHASGVGRDIVVGNGSSHINYPGARVIRASDYCN